jgi:hypothetical protein
VLGLGGLFDRLERGFELLERRTVSLAASSVYTLGLSVTPAADLSDPAARLSRLPTLLLWGVKTRVASQETAICRRNAILAPHRAGACPPPD